MRRRKRERSGTLYATRPCGAAFVLVGLCVSLLSVCSLRDVQEVERRSYFEDFFFFFFFFFIQGATFLANLPHECARALHSGSKEVFFDPEVLG